MNTQSVEELPLTEEKEEFVFVQMNADKNCISNMRQRTTKEFKIHPMYGYDYTQFPTNEVLLNSRHQELVPAKLSFHHQEIDSIDFVPII